jgi:hypothetical protein
MTNDGKRPPMQLPQSGGAKAIRTATPAAKNDRSIKE